MSALSEQISASTLLNNRYRIRSIILEDVSGALFVASDELSNNKEIFIKVLSRSLLANREAITQVRHDLEKISGLEQRGLARLGELFTSEFGPAYVMDNMTGETLEKGIHSHGRPEIAQTVKLLREICSAMTTLHEAGIVHRGLSSQSIFLTQDNHVRIDNFGAGHLHPGFLETLGLTLSEVEIRHLAPEFLSTQTVTPHVDIFAFGVIAYELVAGQSPFKGKTVSESLSEKLRSDIEQPRTHRQECPLVLSSLLLKCIHSDPKRRPQSFKDIDAEFEQIERQFEYERRVATTGLPPAQTQSADQRTRLLRDSIPETGEWKRGMFFDPTVQAKQAQRQRLLSIGIFIVLITILILPFAYFGWAKQQEKLQAAEVAAVQANTPPTPAEGPAPVVAPSSGVLEAAKKERLKKLKMGPLVEASMECKPEAVEQLLKNGENPNARDGRGESAMVWAIKSGDCVSVARLLIEYGANKNEKSPNGLTPYLWAKRFERAEILALLKEKGASTAEPVVVR